MERQIDETYVKTGKAKFVYNHFAFIGGDNGESVHAAMASECANDQQKFWEYHDTIFEHQTGENVGAFSDANLKKFAQDLGLDTAAFNNCLDTQKYRGVVDASNGQARSLGINSTPTVFVIDRNGKRTQITNPVDWPTVQAAIDAALSR